VQDTLAESELFGHEKGAFSGAVSSKPGSPRERSSCSRSIRGRQAALVATGGNKTRAAELIRMPLRTFLTKLKRYTAMDPSGFP
jgi:transcriptional regulator with GAF, ATPase, and Fis domain